MQQSGESPNEVLLRYALERFLYRLAQSPHVDSFMLKGAMLFAVWEDKPHRPTRDIDLLDFPAPLTPEFAADEVMLVRWRGFLRKNRVEPLELAQAGESLRAFLNEPLTAIRRGEAFTKHWPPAGPWSDRPG